MEIQTLQDRSQKVLKELKLLITDILDANEENSQWAINWIDKVNRLSQVL